MVWSHGLLMRNSDFVSIWRFGVLVCFVSRKSCYKMRWSYEHLDAEILEISVAGKTVFVFEFDPILQLCLWCLHALVLCDSVVVTCIDCHLSWSQSVFMDFTLCSSRAQWLHTQLTPHNSSQPTACAVIMELHYSRLSNDMYAPWYVHQAWFVMHS